MKCKYTAKHVFSISGGQFLRKAWKRCETGHSTRIYQTHGICGGSRLAWKWTKKLFFHLLDLTIVNSCNILASYGSKLSHWQFRLTMVRDPPPAPGRVAPPQTTRQRRQAPSMIQVRTLNLRHNRHWLMQRKRIWCCVCSTKKQRTRTN
jgi:hypothetical protein